VFLTAATADERSMTLRPNHCAASIFVTLFCTVSSATGVDYVTTPGDLQGFAVDQSPFDKNGTFPYGNFLLHRQ
jgi:hypothetical protein